MVNKTDVVYQSPASANLVPQQVISTLNRFILCWAFMCSDRSDPSLNLALQHSYLAIPCDIFHVSISFFPLDFNTTSFASPRDHRSSLQRGFLLGGAT